MRGLTGTFALLALAAACSAIQQSVPIVKDVRPIPAVAVGHICIETNQSVAKHRLDEDIASLLGEHGITSQPLEGAFQGECDTWLRYQATWAGRLPSYLATANIEVYEGPTRRGYIRYDASQGHGRMDRQGTTKSKLRPLIAELLAQTTRPE